MKYLQHHAENWQKILWWLWVVVGLLVAVLVCACGGSGWVLCKPILLFSLDLKLTNKNPFDVKTKEILRNPYIKLFNS